jgi:hypothetical protein
VAAIGTRSFSSATLTVTSGLYKRVLPGLTLIETSEHVPGHQSVLVRLPKTGTILLTIDEAVGNTQKSARVL